jgi:(2Fe-2S) ferredoxin
MGSSCFSRGNGLNAEHLQRLMEKGALGDCSDIELVGCLCEGQCKDGPIITIDGTRYRGVSPEILEDILRTHRERKTPAEDGGCV